MTEISLSRYLDEIQNMLERNSLEEAVAHSQHILKHYPRNATTYRYLGQGLAGLGRWEDATAVFRRLLGAYPNDFTAHYQLSIGFEKLSQIDRAIWHLERSFELQPNNTQVIENLRRLYKEHRGVDLQKVQLSTGAVATGYLDSALYEDAVKSLNRALQQHPDRTDLKLQLARALWALNQRVDAAETALDVLEKLPFAVPANRILTELWLREERPSDAQRYLSRIETVDPYLAMRVATGSTPPADRFRLPELDYRLYTSRALSEAAPDWLSSIDDDSAEVPVSDNVLDEVFPAADSDSFAAATDSDDAIFDEFSLDEFDDFDDDSDDAADEFSLDEFDEFDDFDDNADIITHKNAENITGEEGDFDFDDALFDPDTDFPFDDSISIEDDEPASKTETGGVTRIDINPQAGVMDEEDIPDDVRARIDAMEGIAASETVAATAPGEFIEEELDHILQADEQGWLEELQDDLEEDAPVAGRTGLTGLLSTLSNPEETIEDDDAWLTELASGQFNTFDDNDNNDDADDVAAVADADNEDVNDFFDDLENDSDDASAEASDFFANVDAIEEARQRSPSSPLRERASTGFTDEFNLDDDDDSDEAANFFDDFDLEDDTTTETEDENIPTTDAADPMAWMNDSGIELNEEEDTTFEDAFFDDGGDISLDRTANPDAWMQQSGIEFDADNAAFDFDDDSDDDAADPMAWMNDSGAEMLDDVDDDDSDVSANLYAPDMLEEDIANTSEDTGDTVSAEMSDDALDEFLEFESFLDDDFGDDVDEFNDFDEVEKFVLPDSDPVPDYPVAQDREVMPSEMLPGDDASVDMILDMADEADFVDDIPDDEISEMNWASDILDDSVLPDDADEDNDDESEDAMAWLNEAGIDVVDPDEDVDEFNDFDEVEKFVLPDSDPVPDYPVALDREVMPSEMLPGDDASADMILDMADETDFFDDILPDDDDNAVDPMAWMSDAGAELLDNDESAATSDVPDFFAEDTDNTDDTPDDAMPDFFADMTVDESILANRQIPEIDDISDEDLMLLDEFDELDADDEDLLWLEDEDALAMDDAPLPKTDDLPSNERDVLGWLEDDLLIDNEPDAADSVDAILEELEADEDDALAWMSDAGAELLEEGDGNADTGYDSGEDDVIAVDDDSSEPAPRRSMLDWMVIPGTDDLKSTDELLAEQSGTTEENETMLEDTFLPEDNSDNDDWLSDLDDGADEPDWWDSEMDDFVEDDFAAASADDASDTDDDEDDADWLSDLSLETDDASTDDDFDEDEGIIAEADWLSELSLDDDLDADEADTDDNAGAILAAGAAAGAGLAAAWVADDTADESEADTADADWLNEFSLDDEDALEITAQAADDDSDEQPEWLTDAVADADDADNWMGELDFEDDTGDIDDAELLTLEDAGMDWLEEDPAEALPELSDEVDFASLQEASAASDGDSESDLNWMELMTDPHYDTGADAVADVTDDVPDDSLDWSLEPEGDELVADETDWLDDIDLEADDTADDLVAETADADWLDDLGFEDDDMADDLVAETADADWLDDLGFEDDDADVLSDDTVETEPESAIPDWLGSMDEVDEEDDVFAAAAISEEGIEEDAEGDWLEDLDFEDDLMDETDSTDPVGAEIDWLDGVNPEDEPTEEDILTTATAIDADWLDDLGFEDDDTAEDLVAEASDADWLSELDFEDDTDNMEDADEAFPLAESSASDGFDDGEDDDFIMFEDEDDAFAFGDDIAAEIVDAENEDSVYTEDEAEYDPAPADNAPDWLNAMVPGLDVDYDAPEDAPVEATYAEGNTHRNRDASPVDASTLENFAWVQDIAENEEVDTIIENDDEDLFSTATRFIFSRLPVWLRNQGESDATSSANVAEAAAIAIPDYLNFSDDEPDDTIDADSDDSFDDFMDDLSEDDFADTDMSDDDDSFDDFIDNLVEDDLINTSTDDNDDSFDDFMDDLSDDDFTDTSDSIETSGEDDFDFEDDIDDFDDGFDDFDFEDLDD